MTIRHYSSLDAGAPALTDNMMYTNLRAALLACLVSGYGSKPGAGWAVGHDVSGGFSLSNGNGVINFVKETEVGVRIYLMEAITDGATALAGGVNRQSSIWRDGSASASRHGFNFWGSGMSAPHWSCVADDKTAIFQLYGGFAGVDTSASGRGGVLYLGNYVNSSGLDGPSLMCALGGQDGASVGGTGLGSSGIGTVLRDPFTGVLNQGGAYSAVGARFSTSSAVAARSPLVPTKLFPVRTALTNSQAGGAVAGYLRGLVSEPTLSCALYSNICDLLGLSKTVSSRLNLINLPGGIQWAPFFAGYSTPGFFVSLDAKDWG